MNLKIGVIAPTVRILTWLFHSLVQLDDGHIWEIGTNKDYVRFTDGTTLVFIFPSRFQAIHAERFDQIFVYAPDEYCDEDFKNTLHTCIGRCLRWSSVPIEFRVVLLPDGLDGESTFSGDFEYIGISTMATYHYPLTPSTQRYIDIWEDDGKCYDYFVYEIKEENR